MYQVLIFFTNKTAVQNWPKQQVRNGEIFKLVVEHPFLFH